MARKDEVRTSRPIVKYMQYTSSTDCGKYILYEFTDESGNVGLHYQLNPELIEDKKAKGMARLWQTKVSRLSEGDIAIVVTCCKEIKEEQYDNSVFYLNVEKIIKAVSKYKTVTKYYNGVLTDFVEEEHVTSWDDVRK